MKFLICAVTGLSVLAAIASPPRTLEKRATVDQVQQDLSSLQTDLTVLTTSLNAIPSSGATLADIVPVGLNALLLADTIAQTTLDFASITGGIPIATGLSMLTTIQQIEAAIVTSINLAVAKKAPLESVLPGAGLFALKNFRTLTTNIANAMIAVAPITVPSLTMSTIKNALDASFSTAITVFS